MREPAPFPVAELGVALELDHGDVDPEGHPGTGRQVPERGCAVADRRPSPAERGPSRALTLP